MVLGRFDIPFSFGPPHFDRTRPQHTKLDNSPCGRSRSLYLLLSIYLSIYDTLLLSHTGLFSVIHSSMAGKSVAKGRRKAKNTSRMSTRESQVPDIYREMLAEALPQQSLGSPQSSNQHKNTLAPRLASVGHVNHYANDLDDKLDTPPGLQARTNARQISPQKQIVHLDSAEESDESDCDWQDIEFNMNASNEPIDRDIEITLTRTDISEQRKTARKRKAITKADRLARIAVHKMHVLCLLSYLARRNSWCNDNEVQSCLRSLLSSKTLKFLRPSLELSQFGRTESLKRGLHETSILWQTQFKITEQGLRRALWSEDEKDIRYSELADNVDSVVNIQDFRKAANSLKGSRDVGAQLFCALLRSAGVEARLVCSLQPLSFNSGGPLRVNETFKTLNQAQKPKTEVKHGSTNTSTHQNTEAIGNTGENDPNIHLDMFTAVRSRLGHPSAAEYNLPQMRAPKLPQIKKPSENLPRESSYPIFWAEVFDEAHQKWISIDPLVTRTINKPQKFEPPASDNKNNMSYVIAFEDDGCARDVTRRYAKALNSKTIKNRVESTPGGADWMKACMKPLTRISSTDADQIEDTELARNEALEPMPKNITDFKNHPYLALERHLRRNEVLAVGAQECGRVATGRNSRQSGDKKTERIFRRQDVKFARSADAWYRLGRDIQMGQQPVKTVKARKKITDDNFAVDSINLYTEEQTVLYQPPPVVNGRIPKNSYGNIDVFVPTMLPHGAVHLSNQFASHAAKILGIDYAPALTGFEFHGRHGTAILQGIVLAAEYREATEVVIAVLEDEQVQLEENQRRLDTLRMWKRFLVILRIKERIEGYDIEAEKLTGSKSPQIPTTIPDSDDSECHGEGLEDDDAAGGFLRE
ncbi:DNA repair protein Rad4 family protein [Blumeria hordei DH14]|uniref:DNA repair protein Rad4 family protein n=1 Tax=Blumeria graminis f. sp. hordei (strain DH14) TaxID=546991 RepID=N1J534_BLUG1|nr:DNA repair protein Rad4 family protein [Blumeria hordei DH14]